MYSVYCPACGWVGESDGFADACPDCGARTLHEIDRAPSPDEADFYEVYEEGARPAMSLSPRGRCGAGPLLYKHIYI